MRRSLRCNSHRLRTVATCGCMRSVQAFWKAFAAWRIYKDHVHLRKKKQTAHPTLDCRIMANAAIKATDQIEQVSHWLKYTAHVRDMRVENEVLPWRLQLSHIDVYVPSIYYYENHIFYFFAVCSMARKVGYNANADRLRREFKRALAPCTSLKATASASNWLPWCTRRL